MTRSQKLRWHRWLAVGILLAVCAAPREAKASPLPGSDGGAYLAIAYAVITVGGIASSVGAQVWLLKGRASKEWGRASLGFAAANGVVATVPFIMSAFESKDGRPALHAIGGAQLGIAVSALTSGIISELALPPQDPGIPGNPRPTPTAAPQIMVYGRF